MSSFSTSSCQITSPAEAKNDLFNLLKLVAETRQVFIVNRPEGENVALIAESDLASLMETVYLLRTPANARRLLDALEESKLGKIQPQTIEELKQELEIEQKEAEV
ncbi:MAG: type II toxin-antitoxin system Phd/YefM family antitoxin [Hormoscilla sp.]